MINSMSTRARWTEGVPDLSFQDAGTLIANGALPIEGLSNATGLSQKTLRDMLTRDPVTKQDNPQIAICRPSHRFGNQPLWSRAQLADYTQRIRDLDEERKARIKALPSYGAEEAERRGLVTTTQFSELVGVHDQTLRRWARTDQNYPEVVATLARPNTPGNPEHLHDLPTYVSWAEARGWLIPPSLAHQVAQLRERRARPEDTERPYQPA